MGGSFGFRPLLKHDMSKARKYFYIVAILATAGLLAGIMLKKKKVVAGLKERTGTIALSAEWLNTKSAIQTLENDVRNHPANLESKLKLAEGYIQEGRITGNHAYYDKAALELLNDILYTNPSHFEALCCKSTVLLSQHHFSEALDEAKKAVKLQPHTAFVYGLLCDAYVELGNYPAAVKMADQMVAIRPDIRSYARVSYLREIHGDIPGAIEAMKLAASAGYPGLEQTAWTRVTLGHLYESLGDLQNAEQQYYITLSDRPDYAFALAGLGRIEKAKKNYTKAIAYFESAKKQVKDFSFSDELTDLYLLTGDKKRSSESAREVIKLLGYSEDEGDEGHGHYSDRELAYAYLKAYDYTKALEHALIEYKRRPENIDVCETLAWVRYKRGEVKQADSLIDIAMRMHSQNPVLLCRAGLIKMQAGDKMNGTAYITKAIEEDPFIDPFLACKTKSVIENKNKYANK